MGDLKPFHDDLRDSQSRAKKLAETGLALNALFAGEGIRLKREDAASGLRAAHRAIVEQLQRLKEIEASASCGHSQANLVSFLGGLAVTAIVSQGDGLSAITDYLLRGPTDRQQPFRLVMVCIGPGGLPDEAEAISISQLARESRRPQHEIMSKLQEDGCLLFSEEAFSLLVDRLIVDVREGKLRLPVSREKLVEITGFSKPKPIVKLIPLE